MFRKLIEKIQYKSKVRKNRLMKQSNHDIRWWILVNDIRVGELVDGKPDPQSEFWTEFSIILFSREYETLIKNSECWYEKEVCLQDQKDEHIKMTSFLVALRESNRIALRLMPV